MVDHQEDSILETISFVFLIQTSAASMSYASITMSVVDPETLMNNNLKLSVASLVSLEDWADECGACGRPALLHQGGPCT